MNTRPRHARPGQALDERPRHRDDRAEPPERATLQPLVTAVLPTASGEAVDRGDGWNPELTGHAGIHDIRPIAVRVDHIRADTAAQGSHRAPLSPIGAHRQLERMGGNAAVSEGRQEGVPLRGDIQHNGDVHVMA